VKIKYEARFERELRKIQKPNLLNRIIHTLTGYSAHADQNTLVNWVRSMPEPPAYCKGNKKRE